MKRNWRLTAALALAVVLCLPASVVWAGPTTCSGLSCVSAPGEIDQAGAKAWLAENQIQGLTPEHWAAVPIVALAFSGGLPFSKGDTIRPEAPATLWLAARLLMFYDRRPLADLSPAEIARKAAALKLIPGPAEPDHALTRLEAAQLLAGLARFPGSVKPEVDLARVYTDWPAVPAASRDLLYWVTVQDRLFVGFPDHTLRLGEGLTLAQLAVLAQRVADTVLTAPAPPLSEP